jgi:hypothetical protein
VNSQELNFAGISLSVGNRFVYGKHLPFSNKIRRSKTGVGKRKEKVAKRDHFVIKVRSPSLFYLPVHSRCRGCAFALDHTQTHTTVGRTALDEGSARRRDLYLTTQTLDKTKTSMPSVGFEPTIPASARPRTALPLGSAL